MFGTKINVTFRDNIEEVEIATENAMVDLLGVENASDVAALTERDRDKLASLRGWSIRLVDNLLEAASRPTRRQR